MNAVLYPLLGKNIPKGDPIIKSPELHFQFSFFRIFLLKLNDHLIIMISDAFFLTPNLFPFFIEAGIFHFKDLKIFEKRIVIPEYESHLGSFDHLYIAMNHAISRYVILQVKGNGISPLWRL